MSWTAESKWMELAIEQAQVAFQEREVPVGSVLILDGEVVALGHNCVEQGCDASRHSEMECLRLGAQKLGDWRLKDCTLYCTLEPCVMCYGAMVHFRLGRLVWGAPDLRHGALGSYYDLSQRRHPIHSVDWRGPFMAEPCEKLMRDFFKQRRSEASLREARGVEASRNEDGVDGRDS